MNSLDLFGIFLRSCLVNIQNINFEKIVTIYSKTSGEFIHLFSGNGIISDRVFLIKELAVFVVRLAE